MSARLRRKTRTQARRATGLRVVFAEDLTAAERATLPASTVVLTEEQRYWRARQKAWERACLKALPRGWTLTQELWSVEECERFDAAKRVADEAVKDFRLPERRLPRSRAA